MSDTEQEKRELIARHDELRERLRAIHRDYGQALDKDTEDQAQQLENAEVLEGLAKAADEELERIKKRLAELGVD
jgi:RNA polymerase-binding transcription factor DksA